MSPDGWPWVTEPPWNELPPRWPVCRLALTEAPLCHDVGPTCSGAEVTGGTLTRPPLFSRTVGRVQWEEMLGHGCRTLLPRISPATQLLLPGSSSEQDKELQGVQILHVQVPLAARPPRLRTSPCSSASLRGCLMPATSSKPGQAPASGSPQVWPLAASRISLILPCTFQGGDLGSQDELPPALCFPDHNTRPKIHICGIILSASPLYPMHLSLSLLKQF